MTAPEEVWIAQRIIEALHGLEAGDGVTLGKLALTLNSRPNQTAPHGRGKIAMLTDRLLRAGLLTVHPQPDSIPPTYTLTPLDSITEATGLYRDEELTWYMRRAVEFGGGPAPNKNLTNLCRNMLPHLARLEATYEDRPVTA